VFITFEGVEGSGKSTQIDLLIPVLEAKGYECVQTREPGATEIGKKIRAILLDGNHTGIFPLTELLLYEADRAQHVGEVIGPSLAADRIVISDRFFDATVVYQGYARGFDMRLIEQIHDIVVGTLKPDLTIVLDLSVESGLKRAWKRIRNQEAVSREDRFEKEALAFHEKVRNGYLSLAGMEPERFRIIDGSQDPQIVHQAVLIVLREAGLDLA
jgi:dTMP kinase